LFGQSFLTHASNNERLDGSKERSHRSIVSARVILDPVNPDHPDRFVSLRFALSISSTANEKRIYYALSNRAFAILHGSRFHRPFPNALSEFPRIFLLPLFPCAMFYFDGQCFLQRSLFSRDLPD
jgi:hypothetical protein